MISVFPPGSSTAAYTISLGNYGVGRLAVDSADNLYVQVGIGCATSAINVYAPGTTTPAYSISGLSNYCIETMTADQAGNVYLANSGSLSGGGSVLVYAHGSTTPSYTITNGITNPFVMAVDASGNLYVTNWTETTTSQASSVSAYAPGATNPTYTINENGQFMMSFAFALPPRNPNLYVADFNGSVVSSYASGTGEFLGAKAIPQQPYWIAIGK